MNSASRNNSPFFLSFDQKLPFKKIELQFRTVSPISDWPSMSMNVLKSFISPSFINLKRKCETRFYQNREMYQLNSRTLNPIRGRVENIHYVVGGCLPPRPLLNSQNLYEKTFFLLFSYVI